MVYWAFAWHASESSDSHVMPVSTFLYIYFECFTTILMMTKHKLSVFNLCWTTPLKTDSSNNIQAQSFLCCEVTAVCCLCGASQPWQAQPQKSLSAPTSIFPLFHRTPAFTSIRFTGISSSVVWEEVGAYFDWLVVVMLISAVWWTVRSVYTE